MSEATLKKQQDIPAEKELASPQEHKLSVDHQVSGKEYSNMKGPATAENLPPMQICGDHSKEQIAHASNDQKDLKENPAVGKEIPNLKEQSHEELLPFKRIYSGDQSKEQTAPQSSNSENLKWQGSKN